MDACSVKDLICIPRGLAVLCASHAYICLLCEKDSLERQGAININKGVFQSIFYLYKNKESFIAKILLAVEYELQLITNTNIQLCNSRLIKLL